MCKYTNSKAVFFSGIIYIENTLFSRLEVSVKTPIQNNKKHAMTVQLYYHAMSTSVAMRSQGISLWVEEQHRCPTGLQTAQLQHCKWYVARSPDSIVTALQMACLEASLSLPLTHRGWELASSSQWVTVSSQKTRSKLLDHGKQILPTILCDCYRLVISERILSKQVAGLNIRHLSLTTATHYRLHHSWKLGMA